MKCSQVLDSEVYTVKFFAYVSEELSSAIMKARKRENKGVMSVNNPQNNENASKKKQPPFWEREVKVDNPKDVDHNKLLQKMHDRFSAAFTKWRHRSKVFKCTNLLVTLLIVSLQVAQVMLFQFPSVAFETKNSVATIIPAITGAALALQLKLGWGEKAVKCKKCARLYNKLANHVQYRLEVLEAGGTLSDSVKVWNTALTSEIAEIPPFLTVY